MLGEDSGLEFRLNPVKHFGNLVNVDLRDCIHICGLEAVRTWFGHRDDMVIYEKLDGEDMLYPDGFAYLASNTVAAALAERLSQLAAASVSEVIGYLGASRSVRKAFNCGKSC
jgi:hypothetical protein